MDPSDSKQKAYFLRQNGEDMSAILCSTFNRYNANKAHFLNKKIFKRF